MVALTDLFRRQDMKKPRLEFDSDVANFVPETAKLDVHARTKLRWRERCNGIAKCHIIEAHFMSGRSAAW